MVSATVVVERQEEGHALSVQRPIYFISEVLSETKTRYPHIQKLVYAIVLERGIEANPEKVSAITGMGPIRDLKGV